MAKRIPQVRCPICKKPVARSAPVFPFCSERCRTIDLGKWASGQYVVSSPLEDTNEDFDPGPESANSDDE